ncbi:M4 family peptidase [Nocardioides anomalus]|uniref:M4 family peptidase n=2 Tax=Nocardioides anomalus TaxID=2712223 RepID=A0A6G6WLE4_9ACTN|nr:M4 family peptidase [Nocardioides anomalus]
MTALVPTGAGAVGATAAPHATATKVTTKAAATPSGKVAAATSAARLVSAKPEVLHASRHDRFKAGKVLTSLGLQYVPYQRTYRGLPVVGGDFVVSTDDRGRVVATSVAQTRPTRLRSTKATVAKQAARAKSLQRVRDGKLGRTRLVVLQRGTSKLAWETWVTGTKKGQPSRLTVYVDARTGRVLTTKEHVLAGTGTGAWEGNVTIPTSGSGSSYSMTNSNATTLKCQNASGNATFTGTDDVWGNGDATNRETGCVDAFYSAEKERQMLSSWLGRNGMNGSGGWVPIRVGLNDVNAYYDGTQVQVGHTQSGGKWIGSIDVVAHEFGHGVDDKTPGGISGGGTQEFVADTFGAATEWYANNPADVPDFTVGEEVNLVGQGPIRVMYNPSAVGDANCYSSSTPGSEVHSAAGPGNHWYYLLAEGSNPSDGQPTSPTCNGSSVSGIGIQKAQQVMYNAMLLKTSSSSYLKYRTWTLTAAKNLFPGSCTEFNAVKAAWDAVSVPAQSADPTCSATGGVSVTNPGSKSGTVGTAISSFTLAASGGTAPYTWTGTGLPPGVSVSSGGTVSGTPTTAGTYNATVTATAAGGGSGSATFTFTVSGGGGGGCTSPGQKLGNPGFETGSATPWSASSGVVDNSAQQAAHAGSWKAWLDGYGSTHTDTLSQSVTIPAGCTATLSFWLHVDTAETTTSTAYDKLTVKAGSTTLATYSNLNKGSGYTQKSINVSSLAGQTVTISFTGTEDSSLQTSFVIDDTALTVG